MSAGRGAVVNMLVGSDHPRVWRAPQGPQVFLWVDDAERESLAFRDPQHMIDWLEAACDGIDVLLGRDPVSVCEGADLPEPQTAVGP